MIRDSWQWAASTPKPENYRTTALAPLEAVEKSRPGGSYGLLRLRRLLCGRPAAFRQAAEPKWFVAFLLEPAEPERLSLSAQQAAKPRFFHTFLADRGSPGHPRNSFWALLLALAVLLAATGGHAQTAPQPAKKPAAKKPAAPTAKVPSTEAKPVLEPKAIELLKAASSRLAAAHSMAFTAVVTYESPSRLGPPLAYTTKSEVTLQRPDKLRVITLGDGPASEFYYDGKMMMAFAPAENLVAVADAPPTIDATLQAAYDSADIYFPFSDVIVADPYKDIADGLKLAFYIGQSHVLGGTTTDMVAYDSGGVLVQAWIGAEDKLPRMLRAVYLDDPLQLRHQLELSNWQLDLTVPADVFGSSKAAGATRIKFARPEAQPPPGAQPPTKGKPSKAQPSKTQPPQTQ